MIKYIPIITAFIVATVLTVLVVRVLVNHKTGRLFPKFKHIFLASHLDQTLNPAIAKVLEQVAGDIKPFIAFQEIHRELLDIACDAKQPLMLVVTGEFKTGKSTFINTLLGQNILKVDVTPATATVTKICNGSNPGLIAHFKDGSQQDYPLANLAALSAEGDAEGAKIRQELDHLDVVLSNSVLEKYTIVDTPGLNSIYDYHTKATEHFISRADIIFWLFSFGNIGSKTELTSITSLGKELKPIAIINRIDEHDPEEEDLEDLLDGIRHRLGDSVRKVVGVSALLASQALTEGNQDKLKESRWSDLEKLLDQELIDDSEIKKFRRILFRLFIVLQEIQKIIQLNEKEYKDSYDSVYGENLIADIENRQGEIRRHVKLWMPKKDKTISFIAREYLNIDNKSKNSYSPLETLVAARDKPDLINAYTELSRHREIMKGVYDGLLEERTKLKQEESQINTDTKLINENIERWKKETSEYNQSGIFGGKPFFDFNGRERELINWGAMLDKQAIQINERQEILDASINAFIERRDRYDNEAKDYCAIIRETLSDKIIELDTKMGYIELSKKIAQDKFDNLKWVPEAKKVLEKKVCVKLAKVLFAIERKTCKGEVTVPSNFNDTVEKTLKLADKMIV